MLRQTMCLFNEFGMAALLVEAPNRGEMEKTDIPIVGYTSHWVENGSCPFGCGTQRPRSEDKGLLPGL